MFIVGLTGGIASGKSLVARVFKAMGAHIIDADRIVHELIAPGEEAWKEIRDHFGNDILLPDGSIDRRRLGGIIFDDPKERQWLNACLHPRVFEVYLKLVRRIMDRAPESVVVFDAALLIETGFHRRMDRTVVVYAEIEQQIERLVSRDGLTREQAMKRIESQMPLNKKREYADYVIENTGSREEAEQKAREVFGMIVTEAGANR